MSANKIVELNHVYTTTAPQKHSIKTPFITDMSQVITIKLLQTSDTTDTLMIYPNGFIIRNIVKPDKITTFTNYPLIETDSETWNVQLPN